MFERQIENLPDEEIEKLVRRIDIAAQSTSRYRALETHVNKWWAIASDFTVARNHLIQCPLCYSNTLEIVEGTPLFGSLPKHEFAVIFRIDGSWFHIDSYANAYPQEDGSQNLALGAILLEKEFILLRYADGKQYVARPAYQVPDGGLPGRTR